MSGWKETERVPVELIVLTLLRRGARTKAALYRQISEGSGYRVDVSRARLSTALRRLQEKGLVLCRLEETSARRTPRRTYSLLPPGDIAQDIAFEEYYSTVRGMALLLDFAAFEETHGRE